MPDDLWLKDTYAWSLQQAERLRRLRAGERVNDLDWENIIEEIESVGRGELNAVESLLLLSVLHLMKLRAWPGSTARRKWLADADDFLRQAQQTYRPSMARSLDLERVHRDALQRIPYRRFADQAMPVPTDGTVPLRAVSDRAFTLEDLEAALFPPG